MYFFLLGMTSTAAETLFAYDQRRRNKDGEAESRGFKELEHTARVMATARCCGVFTMRLDRQQRGGVAASDGNRRGNPPKKSEPEQNSRQKL